MDLIETALPGVGVRYEFTTADGDHLGVLVRRDGHRDLLVYEQEDPDACSASFVLNNEESAAIVELFGGSRVTERLSDLRHEVEGLAIEWVSIESDSPLARRTIGDGRIRTQTGASVVAVLRGDQSIPGPGPDFVLEHADIVLVVGSVSGVDHATQLITGRG
jgi:TrkA domain protein